MKAKAKKRVVLRKKHTKSTKPKPLVSKLRAVNIKSKNRIKANKKRNKIAKQIVSKKTARKKDGKFVKGHKNISPGRPQGTCRTEELDQAIREVQSEPRRKNWLKSLIRRSYKDTTLAVAILNRKFPVLKQVELTQKYTGGYAALTPAEACKKMDLATMGKK